MVSRYKHNRRQLLFLKNVSDAHDAISRNFQFDTVVKKKKKNCNIPVCGGFVTTLKESLRIIAWFLVVVSHLNHCMVVTSATLES